LNNLISVIVPAFNEEGNIDKFVELFDKMTQTSPQQYELIFVDDGSTDGTLAKIQAAAEKFKYIKYKRHYYNQGLTAALQTGFSAASGDIYIFYPADLQYLPEDIPALAAPILEGADVATGWKQGKYKKKFVSNVYNYLSRRIFNLKVHDLNSVKAFRAEILKDIFLRKDWHRYLVVLAADKGFKVEEVKLRLYDRHWGKSKFSIFRIPIGALDMIAVKTQISLLKKPLLYFGLAGALFFGLGVIVGLIAIYLRFVLNEGFRPLLYLVILLVGFGLGLFTLGLLGEGMAALREELGAVRKKLDDIERQMKN
jgi:glycosyltransferase involved in cell wall biosynthesis